MRAWFASLVVLSLAAGASAQSPFDPKRISPSRPDAAVASGQSEMPAVLKTAIERTFTMDGPLFAFTQTWTTSFTLPKVMTCEATLRFDPASAQAQKARPKFLGGRDDWEISQTGDETCTTMMRANFRTMRTYNERADAPAVGLDSLAEYAPPFVVKSETPQRVVIETAVRSTPKTPRASRSIIDATIRTVEIDKRSGRIVRVRETLAAPVRTAGVVSVPTQEATMEFGPVGGVCCALVQMTFRQISQIGDKTNEFNVIQRTTELRRSPAEAP